MKEISRGVEASLKFTYGEKWRQALLVHILIGLGRSIMKRSRAPSSLLCEEPSPRDELPEETDETIRELHENPLGYMRLMNEKLADELETQLRITRRGPIKHDSQHNFPDFGELLEAIGVQALLRLENNDEHELADLLESVIQVSWEEAPLAVREDTTRIITLLAFFSANIYS